MNIFSKKNFYLVVGILSILFGLWIIMYAVPSLFVNLFNTYLGIGILISIVILLGMFNKNVAIGMALLFIILYQFGHMTGSNNQSNNQSTNNNNKSS